MLGLAQTLPKLGFPFWKVPTSYIIYSLIIVTSTSGWSNLQSYIFTTRVLLVPCLVSAKKNQVNSHYLKGGLFENLIINEFIKRNFHRVENRLPYFWQDNHGKEIDCLLVNGNKITPVEIKSGKTMSTSYFNNLQYWCQLATIPEDHGYVVYGGEQYMQSSAGSFISWRELDRIPD